MQFNIEVNQYQFNVQQTESDNGSRLFCVTTVDHVKYDNITRMNEDCAFTLTNQHYDEIRDILIERVREFGCKDAIYFV